MRIKHLLLLLTTPLLLVSQNAEKSLDQFFNQELLDSWNIPGAAIAVIKNGEIVFSKGVGVADVSSGKEVSPATLFAVASNTKAFTSAAIARLVDEGKLDWDDRVVEYLPYFQLYDPYVTQECRVRDLLCHRVGLDTFSGDLLWFASNLSREEVIKAAGQLEPVYPFRAGYGYQNIMFMAAGEIVSKVSGQPWETYIEQEFLLPLKMDRTLTSVTQLDGKQDQASPHNDIEGVNTPIEWSNWDNMGPAGSLISSAEDWTRWLELQLNEGELDGKRYFSEAAQQEMWTMHNPKSISGFHRANFPSKHFAGYGLGWDLFDYHGKMIVNHGGGYDGFISQSCLVPEEELGFIILTNNNNFFSWAMMYHILDLYLAGDKDPDFMEMMLDYKTKGALEDIEEAKALNASRKSGTQPNAVLSEYAGDYVDEMYGTIRISEDGDVLHLEMVPTPLFHGRLEHWHYDTFRLIWEEDHMLPDGFVTFQFDHNGHVEGMDIDCPNPDLYFYELDLKKEAKKE